MLNQYSPIPFLKLSAPFLILLLFSATVASATCDDPSGAAKTSKTNATALKYKLGAIAAILAAGAAGVSLPLLAKRAPSLRPESNLFFLIKAFAAGVILATGFVHILPDAFDLLASPCLGSPWTDFPFTGLVAMAASVAVLMIDAFATGIYHKKHFAGEMRVAADHPANKEAHAGHVHVHTHATHGHAHGAAGGADRDLESGGLPELIRRRIISQVLEVGIVVHSVIIGISLGASGSPKTIKPLLGALSFHQFFEGMGLGGCISQAKFESKSTVIMAAFFSLTTPAGIAIGIAIASVYKENSATALIVDGIFNSASAGILLYMALVDLLAADFMNPKLQNNVRLQLGASLSLLLGGGSMSLLAIWA